MTDEDSTKVAIASTKFADFTDLVGKWEIDKDFDRVLALQRVIAPIDWS